MIGGFAFEKAGYILSRVKNLECTGESIEMNKLNCNKYKENCNRIIVVFYVQ